MTGNVQNTTERPEMTAEEIEAWRHWDTASEIAEAVRRYADAGEPMHDLSLTDIIQSILRDKFPTLGAQDNGLGFGATLPPN